MAWSSSGGRSGQTIIRGSGLAAENGGGSVPTSDDHGCELFGRPDRPFHGSPLGGGGAAQLGYVPSTRSPASQTCMN